jgi:hypothetical protein
LKDIDDPTTKDDLQKRIIGIVSKIEPQIRVSIDFLEKDSKSIARITVPKGLEAHIMLGIDLI